jgi:hypothetical protein
LGSSSIGTNLGGPSDERSTLLKHPPFAKSALENLTLQGIAKQAMGESLKSI